MDNKCCGLSMNVFCVFLFIIKIEINKQYNLKYNLRKSYKFAKTKIRNNQLIFDLQFICEEELFYMHVIYFNPEEHVLIFST